jgi:hypothetical protein
MEFVCLFCSVKVFIDLASVHSHDALCSTQLLITQSFLKIIKNMLY